MSNESSIEAGQESKNLATLLWVGTLFLGFIPGLVVYLVKKDDPYIQDQAKEALNWSITAGCAYVLALFLMIIVIGAFLVPVIGVTHIVFCVMGAVAASNGKGFRVPFAVRLVK